MSTATLPVSTVVTISVSAPQPGLLVPNVNNICIVDTEAPAVPSNLTNNLGIYATAAQVGVDWGTTSEAYLQAQAIFNQQPNILAGGGQLAIYAMSGAVTTVSQAIAAVEGLIYVGAYLWAGYSPNAAEVEAAASAVNTLRKILGVSSYQVSDMTSPGVLYAISGSNLPSADLVLYTQAGTAVGARLAEAARLSQQMATNFLAQNSCINMNMKTAQGLTADAGITPAVLTTASGLGVNVYGNIQGVAKWISNGGPNNIYLDNTFNLLWFTNALQVAYFNALATTSTKIPQTEAGMTTIKNALLAVCKQGGLNGYLAPGQWNATDTFGDNVSFLRNITQLGYYIYSQPMAAQSQAVRVTRAAPLVQIAAKLAGGINTGSVSVLINP
jgi:hypothetical protein